MARFKYTYVYARLTITDFSNIVIAFRTLNYGRLLPI